jgi:hypothetical protein
MTTRSRTWIRPSFKPDATKERILEWERSRPELWQTISPAMR